MNLGRFFPEPFFFNFQISMTIFVIVLIFFCNVSNKFCLFLALLKLLGQTKYLKFIYVVKK